MSVEQGAGTVAVRTAPPAHPVYRKGFTGKWDGPNTVITERAYVYE